TNATPPTPPVLQAEPLRRVASARATDGDLDSAKWAQLVAEVAAMLTPVDGSSEVDAFSDDPTLRKIVLARDEVVTTDDDIDVRSVLGALNRSYPSCWTFDVAGLIGSTPELLIGVENNRVISRVLAGTYRVEKNPTDEMPAARKLLSAHKDSTEHAFAIASLQRSLGSVAADVTVDERPHLLPLANVIHSASDAQANLSPDSDLNALDVAAAVHPTAAVGGYAGERRGPRRFARTARPRTLLGSGRVDGRTRQRSVRHRAALRSARGPQSDPPVRRCRDHAGFRSRRRGGRDRCEARPDASGAGPGLSDFAVGAGGGDRSG